jgi:auxin-responsive protein IAA
MNSFHARRNKAVDESGGVYVKVRMDGAPYLRNIDLNILHGYKELRDILEGMFRCSLLGEKSIWIYIYIYIMSARLI